MTGIVKNRPQELTRAELEIMQVLWNRGAAVVHGILDEMDEPKPAYNTVSTIVRILEKKGLRRTQGLWQDPRILPRRLEGRLCAPLYGHRAE